jgi:hypothetical protein
VIAHLRRLLHRSGVETRILKQLLQNDQDVFVAVRDENFLALRFHNDGPDEGTVLLASGLH